MAEDQNSSSAQSHTDEPDLSHGFCQVWDVLERSACCLKCCFHLGSVSLVACYGH